MKTIIHHLKTKEASYHPSVFLLIGLVVGLLSVFLSVRMTIVQGVSTTSVTSQVSSGSDDVTEDGSTYDSSGKSIFIGNGASTSYTDYDFKMSRFQKEPRFNQQS